MYIYESMWILVGVMIGMALAWWITRTEKYVKVGWAVVNKGDEVLYITPSRESAIRYLDTEPTAIRLRTVHMRVFGEPNP